MIYKNFNNINKITFKKIPAIVEKLIEKYELEKEFEDERVKKEMEKAKDYLSKAGTRYLLSEKLTEMFEETNFEGKKKILNKLSSAKLKKIIKETIEGKISSQELSSVIQKDLKLSKKTAEELAKDIKEEFSTLLVQKISEKDKKEKNVYQEKTPSKKTIKIAKPSAPLPKKDVYRETIK
ncbi:hypothetical protein AMJ49_04080 [Parcubacteria bacterium DG_74_2]|nr:MAG: hypothetical protein AMJ49_04080 [Parcubacteria bacterium DG_74_2]